MKIRTRLKLNTWVALCVVALMVISLVWTFREVSIMDRNENLANKMRSITLETILLRDDYLLHREARARVQWQAKSETMRELLESAKGHFTDKENRDILNEAKQNFEATVSLFSTTVERHGRAEGAGGKKLSFDEAELRLINQAFLKSYALQDNIGELYDSAERTSRAARNRGVALVIIFVLGGGMAIVVNSFLLGRITTKRMKALQKGVEIIGGGNLDYRIAAEGDDELADLANESNQMAANLKESYTSIENLNREIAERRQADESLRASEDLYRDLVENSRDLICTHDLKGQLLSINEAAVRLIGFPRERLLRMNLIDGMAPEMRGRLQDYLREIQAQGRAEGVMKMRTAAGDVRYWEYRNTLRTDDPAGAIVRGMARDITERWQAEKSLRASEENFRRSMEESPLGARVVSEEGETIYANRTLLDIYGYDTVEELQKKSAKERYNPESYAEFQLRREKRRSCDDVPSEYDIGIVRKDGEVRRLQVFRKEIVWNGERQYQVLYNDITEQKSAEAALKLSEERYRAFIKQSSEAICLFEVEHAPIDTALATDEQIDLLYAYAVIGECNQIFATSHGYGKPEEMLGFRIGQIFPRLAKENVNYLRSFVEHSHHVSYVETKELARDGTVKCFLNSLIGHVEDGRLVRIWGAKQDISRIKKAEEEIRALNAELEQRVMERTAQLEVANKELEAFAYSISHDLRAPLRAVDGYTRILIEDYAASLDERGKRVCSVISESARNMGKLIEDLLAFSRIGRAEMRLSPVDMATLANSIFFELTTPEDRERIDFHVGPLPQTQGDPALVRQVWMNLINNAVKFSAKKERAVIEVGCLLEGSMRPTADGEEAKLPTEHLRSASVYFIRDSGVGFDMSHADKLFGVFQRLHSTKEFEGTGVGLAIVQSIIQRHGGLIWAEGKTGKGATFYFTLDKAV
jgi:PAS domain S-box-containing protein